MLEFVTSFSELSFAKHLVGITLDEHDLFVLLDEVSTWLLRVANARADGSLRLFLPERKTHVATSVPILRIKSDVSSLAGPIHRRLFHIVHPTM